MPYSTGPRIQGRRNRVNQIAARPIVSAAAKAMTWRSRGPMKDRSRPAAAPKAVRIVLSVVSR